ncbi:mitogen-activated protein kinase kinase kinase 20-like [Anneissia japonica]|uniref:mitogen-activated protein kinase kinase kinase 20-like n=1 Tax=Anneissia japonica TaxID=1529436 RepID=UPI0014257372|nr:mitogen-activated protein kinase kinase kinase 20-like [Anneissia japonica]
MWNFHWPRPWSGSSDYYQLNTNNNNDEFEDIASIGKFEWMELCGSGSFSSVYKATWTERNITVAAKKVLSLSQKELDILKTIKNPCIINILGVISQSPDFYIIMEYANGGNLFNYLRKLKGSKLPDDTFYQWSEHATEAVRYLGSINIAHRDIKSPNYLITSARDLKLCDFGTAKVSNEGTSVTSHEKGSSPWMAPEMIRDKLASKKSDVYSLGIVIWELLTGEIPYGQADNQYQIMYLVAEKGERPLIPEDCPQLLRRLILSCWLEDRDSRPTPQLILERIQTKSFGPIRKS